MATTVKFVDSLTSGLAINPDRFLGAVISAAGRMEVKLLQDYRRGYWHIIG